MTDEPIKVYWGDPDETPEDFYAVQRRAQEIMDSCEAARANRWAAFTNDELEDLLDGLNYVLSNRVSIRSDDMAQAIVAELERRKP